MVKKSKEELENEEKQVQNVLDMKVSDLPGIGPVRTKKLEEAGIHSIVALSCFSPIDLADKTGLTSDECGELTSEARKLAGGNIVFNPITASDVKKIRTAERWRAETGCKGLTELTGGGFTSQTITEVYGLNGSGKSQICFTAAVLEASKGGAVIYIDTENTFSTDRLESIAITRGLDQQKVLDNVTQLRAFDAYHQVRIVEELGSYMDTQKKEGKPVRMIIVDSITMNFRAEYEGRGQLSPRQQLLNRHLKLLSRYAESYNIPVLLTNQVLSNAEGVFGDPLRAVGGNIMGHRATYRIYLRKGSKTKRVALMDDSPEHPRNEIIYYLTTEGVSDTEQKTSKGGLDDTT